jgi:transposase-like protein
LSEHRDIAAAKRFFEQAIEKRGVPEKITLDGYAASHEAVAELQEEDIIQKCQLDLSAICSPGGRTPQVWEAVLAA